MTLFVAGAFTAHSGTTLAEKIECDALTDDDWDCLAQMIWRRLEGEYSIAYGVPRGGLILAYALNAKPINASGGPSLVVDDVLTTGASMRELMERLPGSIGYVVFDRSGGKNLPPNCRALFTLDAAFMHGDDASTGRGGR